MLKVDHMKRVIFECRGIEASMLPRRCREITVDDLEHYVGWRWIDLSEWVLFDPRECVVVSDKSFRSPADAEYDRRGRDLKIRRAVEVLCYL